MTPANLKPCVVEAFSGHHTVTSTSTASMGKSLQLKSALHTSHAGCHRTTACKSPPGSTIQSNSPDETRNQSILHHFDYEYKNDTVSSIRLASSSASTSTKMLFSFPGEELTEVRKDIKDKCISAGFTGQKRKAQHEARDADDLPLETRCKRLRSTASTESGLTTATTVATTLSTDGKSKSCRRTASSKTSSHSSFFDRNIRSRAPSPLLDIDSRFDRADQDQFLLGVGAQFSFRSLLVMSSA